MQCSNQTEHERRFCLPQ